MHAGGVNDTFVYLITFEALVQEASQLDAISPTSGALPRDRMASSDALRLSSASRMILHSRKRYAHTEPMHMLHTIGEEPGELTHRRGSSAGSETGSALASARGRAQLPESAGADSQYAAVQNSPVRGVVTAPVAARGSWDGAQGATQQGARAAAAAGPQSAAELSAPLAPPAAAGSDEAGSASSEELVNSHLTAAELQQVRAKALNAPNSVFAGDGPLSGMAGASDDLQPARDHEEVTASQRLAADAEAFARQHWANERALFPISECSSQPAQAAVSQRAPLPAPRSVRASRDLSRPMTESPDDSPPEERSRHIGKRVPAIAATHDSDSSDDGSSAWPARPAAHSPGTGWTLPSQAADDAAAAANAEGPQSRAMQLYTPPRPAML